MENKKLEVKEVRLVTKISNKSGNPYTILEVEFKNGFIVQTFLDNNQLYILNNLI